MARPPSAAVANGISASSEQAAPDAPPPPEPDPVDSVSTATAREASSEPEMMSPPSSPTADLQHDRGASAAPIPDFMDDGDESAWDCLVHSAGEQPNLGLGTAGSSDASIVLGKGAAGAGSPD